jgi:LysM repeat protein
VQTLTAPMVKWRMVSLILLVTLNFLPAACPFNQDALAAKTQAPVPSGAADLSYPACPAGAPLTSNAAYCLHTVLPGQTLGALARRYATTPEAIMQANQEASVPGQKRKITQRALRAGDRIRIPVPSVAPSSPSPENTPVPAPLPPEEPPLSPPVSAGPAAPPPAPAPPVSVDEGIIPALAAVQEGQQALAAAVRQQGTRLEELIEREQRQRKQREGQGEALTTLTRWIIALSCVSLVTLIVLGAFLCRGVSARPPAPLPPAQTASPQPQQLASAATISPAVKRREASALADGHVAIQYLSTPKGEDSLLSVSTAGLSALAVADGASCCRVGGKERSGGGGAAARIAAREALAHLTGQARPALSLAEMLSLLTACFAVANSALEAHNGEAAIPGATTLMLAALWQAGEGRWYWLYGNVGNGVLSLLHTRERLAGWPVETPLLSKQANGLLTITLPGFASHGFEPAVGLRPHRAGDILLVGSDGLDHLDAVTKKGDRLTLANYLWQHIAQDPSQIATALPRLAEGREDPQWQNALALDDTTIGLMWASEENR